jgi:hypothetical protein
MRKFFKHHEKVNLGEFFSIFYDYSHVVRDVVDQILQLNLQLICTHDHLRILSMKFKFLNCLALDLCGLFDELLQNFVIGDCTPLSY